MSQDIKRLLEIYICDKLTELVVPFHRFVPWAGGGVLFDNAGNSGELAGDESQGAGEANDVDLEPPFTVVAVTDAQKRMNYEGTWFCTGSVQIITNMDETSGSEHSDLVRTIYSAFITIESNSDNPEFSLHGIDVSQTRTAEDNELSAHADIIDFVAGAGG